MNRKEATRAAKMRLAVANGDGMGMWVKSGSGYVMATTLEPAKAEERMFRVLVTVLTNSESVVMPYIEAVGFWAAVTNDGARPERGSVFCQFKSGDVQYFDMTAESDDFIGYAKKAYARFAQ